MYEPQVNHYPLSEASGQFGQFAEERNLFFIEPGLFWKETHSYYDEETEEEREITEEFFVNIIVDGEMAHGEGSHLTFPDGTGFYFHHDTIDYYDPYRFYR